MPSSGEPSLINWGDDRDLFCVIHPYLQTILEEESGKKQKGNPIHSIRDRVLDSAAIGVTSLTRSAGE